MRTKVMGGFKREFDLELISTRRQDDPPRRISTAGLGDSIAKQGKPIQLAFATSLRFAVRSVVVLALAATAGALISVDQSAVGQQYPDLSYYQGAQLYFDADYNDAERYYSRASNSAFRFGNRRFLDSVCYWTMIGECYYHMGNYAEAIKMYEQSLVLYLSHQNDNWQSRITPPLVIQRNDNAFRRAQITWGTPTRKGSIARVPDTFQVMFGQMANERVLQQGGVVQNPEIKKVDVSEIMRCLALCLHRRRVIKGPTTKLDPLTSQLIAGLSGVKNGDGSVLGSYNGVLLGIALASSEDWEEAARVLKGSVQLSGRLDHPLTPIALLETANIAVATGSDSVAEVLALEASYSAAIFNQFDLVEESLSLGTTLHLKSSRSAYPPLASVIEWARRNRARLLQATAIVRLAECYSEAGDPVASAKVLSQAGRAIRPRTTLDDAVVSARLKYVGALNLFLQGDFVRGSTALNAALKHFRTGSLWIYRLSLVDSLVASNAIDSRQADLLYGTLLHDPTEQDWLTDPMESIAFLATPHLGAMERWFEIVLARRDYKRALEISEMIRRHRFFSTLPLGGRQMGFRWVMEAPEEAITEASKKQRAQFFNENIPYRQASEKSRRLIQELADLPLQPDPKSDEGRKQNALVRELTVVSNIQEAMLASNALRRMPSNLEFPPARSVVELRTAFRDDQVALVTFATFRGYHLFLVNKKTVQYISFSPASNVNRQVSLWLKQLEVNANTIDVKELASEDWKETAKSLVDQFFPNSKPEDWNAVSELIVVPDGAIWYLPFEALLIGDGEEETFLSERTNVRYAPTLALSVGAQRKSIESKVAAVVVSKLHGKGDVQTAKTAFVELKKTMPDAAEFETLKLPTNAFGSIVDTLIVWSEVPSTKGRPLAMAPMQMGTGKLDGTLGDWVSLPWRGPEQIVIPYFQADGIGMRGNILGNDLFLTTMAMMAAGTRTVLVSRWSTGGKTTLDLSRQFIEKQKEDGIPKALADSRAAVRELELDFENEPRIRVKADDVKTKASHPFFWAGPMLLTIPNDQDLKVAPVVDPGDSDGKDGKKAGDKDPADGDAKLPGVGNDKMPEGGEDKMPGAGDDKPQDDEPKMDSNGQASDPNMKTPVGNPPSKGATEGSASGEKVEKADGAKENKTPKTEPPKPSGVGWQPRPPKPTGGGGENPKPSGG